MVQIGNDWDAILNEEFQQSYYLQLREQLKQEYGRYTVYPDMYHLFEAFKLTPYHQVRVVILGQDPYHNPGQAHGLAFSVSPGTRVPPSLQNIYKELESELGCKIPDNGYLVGWAEQGVLLLNTSLSVRKNNPNSHKDLGWHLLTDQVIRKLNEREEGIVFLLWGRNAIDKKNLINGPQHLVLTAPHPSPFSARRGFFGCGHFIKTNEFLMKRYGKAIDWQINDIGV